MQQQSPAAAWIVIEAIAVRIFGNVRVDQPDLAILDRDIGFRDICLAVAE